MSMILAAMINGAIVSGLITLAVLVGLRLAHRRLNAATRHLVWWIVLAIAGLLPLWYLPEDLFPRTVNPPSRQMLLTPIEHREVKEPVRSAARALDGKRTAPARVVLFPIRIAAGNVPQWAGAAWAVTSSLMLLRLAMSWMVLGRRKARATEAPPSLSARLDCWLAQCGSSRRRVRIAVSTEIAIPTVAGLFHPSILFPANLLKVLDEGQLDQIGLHEAAHVARRDDCTLLVQRFVEALFVPHPVVRWVARRIDLEREIACDDFVVQAAGNPLPYAACLTRVAELTNGTRGAIVAAAAADDRSHLTRRVDMLLDRSRPTGTRPLTARLAAVVAVIASMAWVGAHAPGMIIFAMPMVPVLAPAAGTSPHAAASPLPFTPMKPPPQALPPPATGPVRQTVSAQVVTIPVAVRDPADRFVTGLDKGTFRLFEDGAEQEITAVRTAHVPLSVGLLIDTGSSMGAKFGQVDESIRQSVRMGNPADDFLVVKFDGEARLDMGITRDRDPVQHQSAQAGPRGGTALFDAVSLAMRQMRVAHNSQKAILVITGTGSDNASFSDAQRSQELKVIAELVQNNVRVYTFGNDPPARFLAELTEDTGGSHFMVGGDVAAVAESASRIGEELRNLYGVEYMPRNALHDGAYRKVQVELITPRGLPPLKLSYQPGYYESRR